MRSLTHWVLTTFASPVGILILAALDSTLFVWLPFGIDAATVVLSMRGVAPWWAVALLATGGSVVGALATFWMGDKVGDAGLERFAPARYLASARKRIQKKTRSGALAALSLIPPPFPFTPIVLAAGALEVKAAAFFSTLAACRFLRFGIEAYLARRYGPQTLDWVESPIVGNAVLAFLAAGIALTALTLFRIVRSPARSGRRGRGVRYGRVRHNT
jgi:membrane protein YqaA with SNARE-associated domain